MTGAAELRQIVPIQTTRTRWISSERERLSTVESLDPSAEPQTWALVLALLLSYAVPAGFMS